MTTRIRQVIFSLAALMFMGCADPTTTNNNDVDCADTQFGCDKHGNPNDFMASVHMVVPYGWSATEFKLWPEDKYSNQYDAYCEGLSECTIDTFDVGYKKTAFRGDNFTCVVQTISVQESDVGKTIEMVDDWLGEGVCGLTPDGDYSNHIVHSGDMGEAGEEKRLISIDSRNAVITGSEFFWDDRTENSGVLLDGTVAEDLSWIEYELIRYDGDIGFSGTIYLQ